MKYIMKYNLFEAKGFRVADDNSEYVQYFKYKVLDKEPIENLKNYKDHRRLRVFYEKGLDCPTCSAKGTQIIHGIDAGGGKHVDICDDNLYPMTIDHIIPRSKGGSDDIDNLRPMCCLCNWRRGNGDKPGPLNVNKYPKKYLKFDNDINIGDVVYKNTTDELLGEVIEILPNPRHPENALSVRIKERNPNSLYALKSLYKK